MRSGYRAATTVATTAVEQIKKIVGSRFSINITSKFVVRWILLIIIRPRMISSLEWFNQLVLRVNLARYAIWTSHIRLIACLACFVYSEITVVFGAWMNWWHLPLEGHIMRIYAIENFHFMPRMSIQCSNGTLFLFVPFCWLQFFCLYDSVSLWDNAWVYRSTLSGRVRRHWMVARQNRVRVRRIRETVRSKQYNRDILPIKI